MRITGADIRPRGPAPALGGDTDAVLAEIGYTADEAAALAAAGSSAGARQPRAVSADQRRSMRMPITAP